MTRQENWVMTYEQGLEFVEDLNGISWYDAPKPRRLHRCTPQTNAYISGGRVERCACGAVQINSDKSWREKNSRRH